MLLSECNFGTLHFRGLTTLRLLNHGQAKSKHHIFAKTQKWTPEVWFGLKFFWSKTKRAHFCEQFEEKFKRWASEITNRLDMAIFYCSAFWSLLIWLSPVVFFELRVRHPQIFSELFSLNNQLENTKATSDISASFQSPKTMGEGICPPRFLVLFVIVRYR